MLSRIRAIGPGGESDLEYREGLRLATEAAIDYTIDALEGGTDTDLSVPGPLVSQARLAARRHVPLEVMLRRYLAGHAVLGDFLIEEAGRLAISPGVLRPVLRSQAVRTDQALAMIGAAYLDEVASKRPRSGDERRAEIVGRLLDGELAEAPELAYAFGGFHLGLAASGEPAAEVLEAFARALDCRLLLVRREDGPLWAWLGSRRRLGPQQVEALAPCELPALVSIAAGEPAEGLAGWRLTHQQAEAALPAALRGGKPFVRYAEVALAASMLRDDLLVVSLRQLYLTPLAEERDGGVVARETLRAYFDSDRNVSSTAAMLKVDRRTVTNRIRAVEERIGRPFDDCAADLQMALRLDDLG